MSARTPLTSGLPGPSTAGTTTSGVMTRQDPSTGKCRYIDSVLVKLTIRLLIVMGLLSVNDIHTCNCLL